MFSVQGQKSDYEAFLLLKEWSIAEIFQIKACEGQRDILAVAALPASCISTAWGEDQGNAGF
jgi:hypothetical protein